LAGGVFLYTDYYWYPRCLAEVVPGKIYRSAQPSYGQLARLTQEVRLKTIINLRGDEVAKNPDLCKGEEQFARDNGIKLVTLRFGPPPPEEDIKRLLDTLDDKRNHPVLIHCAAGVDRTGIAIAIYRIERMGWTNRLAVTEMISNGFAEVDSFANLNIAANYKRKHPAPSGTKGTGNDPAKKP
jgi:protein tyrosine/serine phosphatase